jgi:hypothetical protein
MRRLSSKWRGMAMCALNNGLFLGAFAKLRKATISFVMSVCLSDRMEELGSHWTDFQEI